jgi:hypothetical protein
MTIIIHDAIEQGTEAWHKIRLGLPTASMFSAILAKGEGKTRRSYMLKLAGERLTGEPTESYSNPYMERGKVMEDEARDLFAFQTGAQLTQVGFITNGEKGCSPDSLIGDNGMLEIKTKRSDLLIDVILKDELPSEHTAQCQGALWVAEREWLDFVAYWPNLPLFVKRVARNESYIQKLATEVDRFNEELQQVVEQIRRRGLEGIAA